MLLDMPREPMPTPVGPLSVHQPAGAPPDYWIGVTARLEAVVGRFPRPATDENDADEGAGLCRRIARVERVVGRFPGTEGADDEGEGIAAHVFAQRYEASRGRRLPAASLATAIVAAIGALASLWRVEAARASIPVPLPYPVPMSAVQRPGPPAQEEAEAPPPNRTEAPRTAEPAPALATTRRAR
jgi:hypothetical protein